MSPLAASSNRCASTISIELAAGIHICQPLKSRCSLYARKSSLRAGGQVGRPTRVRACSKVTAVPSCQPLRCGREIEAAAPAQLVDVTGHAGAASRYGRRLRHRNRYASCRRPPRCDGGSAQSWLLHKRSRLQSPRFPAARWIGAIARTFELFAVAAGDERGMVLRGIAMANNNLAAGQKEPPIEAALL